MQGLCLTILQRFGGAILWKAGVVPHHFVEIAKTILFCRDCKNHFVEEELVTSETICFWLTWKQTNS